MIATDNLFQLIRSLTSAEKRYFKLFAQRHMAGAKNSYVRLFDAIDKWPVEHYVEKDFLKANRGKAFTKYFADEKKRLEESVLLAMRNFHSGESIENQIANLIGDELFFTKKRINTLRKKSLEKAKALAFKFEKTPALLQVLEKETILQIEWQQQELTTIIEEQRLEEKAALEQLNVLSELRYNSNLLFTRLRVRTPQNTSALKDEAARILNLEVVKNYVAGTRFSTDFHFYRIHAIYNRVHNNLKQHQAFSKSIYELYEIQYPWFKDTQITAYKISLFNYLNACFIIGDFSNFSELLQRARRIPVSNKDEEGEDWQNLIHLELVYMVNTFQLEKTVALAMEIERGLKAYRNKVNKARELALYYNLGSAFLVSAKWDKALDYYNKILQDNTEARLDLKEGAQLLLLVAHYQLKNYDLVDYMIANTERRLRPATGAELSYSLFFKFMRNLLKNKTTFAEIAQLKKDISRFPELLVWIEARQSGKNISIVFEESISSTA